MKRLVPLLFIVSLIISACTCQAQQQRYLGIVLGPNLANESTDSIPIGTPTSGRTGILAGIRLERWFSPQWGFSTEVDYVQEGRTDNLYGEGAGIFSGFTRTGAVTIKAAYI